jgi:predicted amidohydrolase
MGTTMAPTTLAAANVAITHDKRANLARFLDLVDEAAARGADVLVLPEAGLQGYADFSFGPGTPERAEQKRYYLREAEPIPGPATEAVRERAARHGMHVQLGLAERALHGNVVYNSTALIGPRGVVGVYRKVHNQFEFPYFGPGEATPVFDLPFSRVASLICYDLAFPELMRSFAVRGAEVALMSTAWPMRGHDRDDDYHGWAMDLAARANAFFNQMWLVVSNHCETGAYSTGTDYYGNSQIVDPCGKVVACLGEKEGLVVHTADLAAEVLASRTDAFFGLSLLQDRRPEHYRALVDDGHRTPPAHPGAELPPPGDLGPDPRHAGGASGDARSTPSTPPNGSGTNGT